MSMSCSWTPAQQPQAAKFYATADRWFSKARNSTCLKETRPCNEQVLQLDSCSATSNSEIFMQQQTGGSLKQEATFAKKRPTLATKCYVTPEAAAMLTLAKRNLLSWLTNRIKEQQLLTVVSSLCWFTSRNKEQQLPTLAKRNLLS